MIQKSPLQAEVLAYSDSGVMVCRAGIDGVTAERTEFRGQLALDRGIEYCLGRYRSVIFYGIPESLSFRTEMRYGELSESTCSAEASMSASGDAAVIKTLGDCDERTEFSGPDAAQRACEYGAARYRSLSWYGANGGLDKGMTGAPFLVETPVETASEAPAAELTPDMIQAGVMVFKEFLSDLEDMVGAIYSAMERARRPTVAAAAGPTATSSPANQPVCQRSPEMVLRRPDLVGEECWFEIDRAGRASISTLTPPPRDAAALDVRVKLQPGEEQLALYELARLYAPRHVMYPVQVQGHT